MKKQRNQQESSGFTPGFSADDGGHGGGAAPATLAPLDGDVPPADPDLVQPGDPGTYSPGEQITKTEPTEAAENPPPAKIEGDGNTYFGPEGKYDAEGNYQSYEEEKKHQEKKDEKKEEPAVETAEEKPAPKGPSREELLAKADALAKKNFNNVFEDITRWEDGKDYAEVGIGGYKWFPNGATAAQRQGVEEDFPKLIDFMVKGGYPKSKLPKFINYTGDSKVIGGLTTPSKAGFEIFKKSAKTGSARVDHTGKAKQVPTDFRELQNWLHDDDVRVWQMRYELSRES